jgi:hypothetical protein
MSSITVIHEVWRALKNEIDEANLPDAAESLVDVLIQNDYEASDIKAEFRRDSHVMDAVKAYIASQEEEEEEYEEEYEDDEDYDDNW